MSRRVKPDRSRVVSPHAPIYTLRQYPGIPDSLIRTLLFVRDDLGYFNKKLYDESWRSEEGLDYLGMMYDNLLEHLEYALLDAGILADESTEWAAEVEGS